MESSNDAAEVLASAYGNDAFVKKMNEKSSKLSMSNTLFVDASGLSPLNVSTTKDLFTLISYINLNRLEIWDITKTKEYSILTHKWTNTNSLARRKSYVGGRNGYTEDADNTSASIFEINIDNQKRKIAIILLKSSDRNADVDAIIRFLENNVGINNTENTEKDGTLLNK